MIPGTGVLFVEKMKSAGVGAVGGQKPETVELGMVHWKLPV